MSDIKTTDLEEKNKTELAQPSVSTETVEITSEVEVTNEGTESETEIRKTKKNKLVGKILLAIALIILMLLLLKQCYNNEMDNPMGPQGNNSAIVDGELDLMDYEQIKAGLQAEVDKSYMNLIINLNPVFNGLNEKGNLFIQNSASNRSNIQVHIYLEETNDLIYVSPILKPNQSVPEDVLTNTENLTTGTHKCLAMFSVLNPETGEKTSETGIKINLTIQ